MRLNHFTEALGEAATRTLVLSNAPAGSLHDFGTKICEDLNSLIGNGALISGDTLEIRHDLTGQAQKNALENLAQDFGSENQITVQVVQQTEPGKEATAHP